jgi:hypothetical protein
MESKEAGPLTPFWKSSPVPSPEEIEEHHRRGGGQREGSEGREGARDRSLVTALSPVKVNARKARKQRAEEERRELFNAHTDPTEPVIPLSARLVGMGQGRRQVGEGEDSEVAEGEGSEAEEKHGESGEEEGEGRAEGGGQEGWGEIEGGKEAPSPDVFDSYEAAFKAVTPHRPSPPLPSPPKEGQGQAQAQVHIQGEGRGTQEAEPRLSPHKDSSKGRGFQSPHKWVPVDLDKVYVRSPSKTKATPSPAKRKVDTQGKEKSSPFKSPRKRAHPGLERQDSDQLRETIYEATRGPLPTASAEAVAFFQATPTRPLLPSSHPSPPSPSSSLPMPPLPPTAPSP